MNKRKNKQTIGKVYVTGIILCLCAVLMVSCKIRINNSIHIKSGENVRGSQNSINGNIFVADNSEVHGSCRTVNGRIEVGDHSRVEKLQTVNGSINLGPSVKVYGNVESVNGSVDCQEGTFIKGDIKAINGAVNLEHTKITDDIVAYNGDITVQGKSLVEGDIVIKHAGRGSRHRGTLFIRIIDDSVVKGDVRVEDDDIDVEVHLQEGGQVLGKIINADVFKQEPDEKM